MAFYFYMIFENSLLFSRRLDETEQAKKEFEANKTFY